MRVSHPKLVIANDHIVQSGGAERVLLSMERAFAGVPIVTTVFDPELTFPAFGSCDIRTTWLQRMPLMVRHHRIGFPLYAPTFSGVTVDAPLVVCSTAGWSHGLRTTGLKVLYVHNTARWLYQRKEYLAGSLVAAAPLLSVMSPPLRRWDRASAKSADKLWVTSKVVQNRVWRHWSMESEIFPPPHGADPAAPQTSVAGIDGGFLLVVARLIHWKRVDAVVKAMESLKKHRLVVVGDGPEGGALRREAPSNCTFLGVTSQAELRWLYANCLALVSASHEDFGLTPLEAMAFGKPVVVLRRGGYLETVKEGDTGVFFDEQCPESVAAGVRSLVSTRWDPDAISKWGARYSESSFIARFREEIEHLLDDPCPVRRC